MRAWYSWLSYGLVLMVSVSCQWGQKSKPSVLVIAVESLGTEFASCTDTSKEKELSGISVLCAESIRFTHAYTPSVLSQSALSSLLTGKYPFEHKVRHNGPKALSAKFKTVAEEAMERKYRTSFFSGGPPIWSFSGLGQGFEVFLDHYSVDINNLYQPIEKTFLRWKKWLKGISSRDSFFSFIYVPDLQFLNVETKDQLGQLRGRGYQGQVQELDESLYGLFRQMKSDKRWDNTFVILLGLNGRPQTDLRAELEGTSLYSSNTEVALLIKPARKKRDLGLQWKMDRNVSLVDVGVTLREIVTGDKVEDQELPVYSLLEFLDSLEGERKKDRFILHESGWARWHGKGSVRFALREGHLLFINDEKLKVFNTYVDHFESAPFLEENPATQSALQRTSEVIERLKLRRWEVDSKEEIEKLELATHLWKESSSQLHYGAQLNRLMKDNSSDEELKVWMAENLLQKGSWESFKKVSLKNKNEEWLFFAKRALKETNKKQKGCLGLFERLRDTSLTPNPKTCDDRLFVDLFLWLSHRGEKKEVFYQRKFLKKYRWRALDRKIAKLNYQNHKIWNVKSKSLNRLDLSTLTLYLPEFYKEKRVVEKFLKN